MTKYTLREREREREREKGREREKEREKERKGDDERRIFKEINNQRAQYKTPRVIDCSEVI